MDSGNIKLLSDGTGLSVPWPVRRIRSRITLTGWVIGVVLCQIVLLAVAGRHHRFEINPDAVSYIRIATYYASGQNDLMVSGYWGPLLSWIMAPLLALGAPPLATARVVMGFSAVLFLLGSVRVFRAMRMSRGRLVLGAWIVALASVYWSVVYITPDLLMSGLLCLAVGGMMSVQWLQSRYTQIGVGVLFGMAYLSKAIAFPLMLGICFSLAGLWSFSRRHRARAAWRGLALTLTSFFLFALPWVIVLSFKYDHVTFSTSGTINHAIMGPADVDRYHPTFNGIYHVPEMGRLTSWEDPGDMPYKYWSPFESAQYARHQAILIVQNLWQIIQHLRSFDFVGIGLFALFGSMLFHTSWRESLAGERWRWAFVPVLCLSALYLPVYAGDFRYFYAAYPFLLGSAVAFAGWVTRELPRMAQAAALITVILSFGYPIASDLPRALSTPENRADRVAFEVAKRLKEAGLSGPIAGIDGVRGYASLFIAFTLGTPWYGSEPNASVDRIGGTGANLVVGFRHTPVSQTQGAGYVLVDLDSVLFENAAEASRFPLRIYQVKRASTR